MLIDQLKSDNIAAMKARDSVKRGILQVVIGVATKDIKEPSDEVVLKSIKKVIGANKETLENSVNPDLEKENKILEEYLPETLSTEALTSLFEDFINTNEINKTKVEAYRSGDQKSFGFLMGNMVKFIAGRADSKDVKVMIEKEFNTK